MSSIVLTASFANMVLQFGSATIRASYYVGHHQSEMRTTLTGLGTGGFIFRIGHLELTPLNLMTTAVTAYIPRITRKLNAAYV